MKTLDFFASHPVFSLAEATEALSPEGGPFRDSSTGSNTISKPAG